MTWGNQGSFLAIGSGRRELNTTSAIARSPSSQKSAMSLAQYRVLELEAAGVAQIRVQEQDP